MKIEIGESLCYSFLRHVRQCWVVQANWKVSEHWAKLLSEGELDERFRGMRERFDPDGSVFKGTKGGQQFLKQGEIDAVGLGQDGSVHAMDVAFHESGLNYVGGVDKRVLKKLLRTMFVLDAYHPEDVERHIYFASPKVHKGVQEPLEKVFGMLATEYPSVRWHLLTNEEFNRKLLIPTLEKAGKVADTSELFVRAAKLLELSGPGAGGGGRQRNNSAGISTTPSGRLQPLVQELMRTMLEVYPDLLEESDLQNMMDSKFCKDELGLKLSGFSLLRRVEEGRMESGHPRYWPQVYRGEFYVTKNWWRDYHPENARALARFVEGLISRQPGHPAVPELERHKAALERYAG